MTGSSQFCLICCVLFCSFESFKSVCVYMRICTSFMVLLVSVIIQSSSRLYIWIVNRIAYEVKRLNLPVKISCIPFCINCVRTRILWADCTFCTFKGCFFGFERKMFNCPCCKNWIQSIISHVVDDRKCNVSISNACKLPQMFFKFIEGRMTKCGGACETNRLFL